MQKTYYYTDELTNDFANTKIKTKQLKADYSYVPKSGLFKAARFVIYRLIATPVIKLYFALKRVKIVNKKALKKYKKGGAFIYGNHTSYLHDAFLPAQLAFPRAADVVVNPDAVSLKGFSGVVRCCGGVPVPSDINGLKNFSKDMQWAVENKHWVAIYPEAHIWPYYTGVRKFSPSSFKYPAKCGAPVFAYTTVYKKRKLFKKPKKAVYVDGPFFADESLPLKARAQQLCDLVYNAMSQRAGLSTQEYISYVHVTDPEVAEVLNGLQSKNKRLSFPAKRRKINAICNEMYTRYTTNEADILNSQTKAEQTLNN